MEEIFRNFQFEFTLFSGRLRIFWGLAGGQATADATAFIIFVWFDKFRLICWLFGVCCTCVCVKNVQIHHVHSKILLLKKEIDRKKRRRRQEMKLTCCWILKLLLVVVLLLFVLKLLLLLTARGDSNAEFMVCCDKCDADVCKSHWSESGSSQGPSLQINNKNKMKH